MLQIVETGTQAAEDFLLKLKARGQLTDESILKTVRRTLSDVQAEGDKAVVRYTRKLDAPRISVKELTVSREEVGEAYLEVPTEFIDAITHARTNIEKIPPEAATDFMDVNRTQGCDARASDPSVKARRCPCSSDQPTSRLFTVDECYPGYRCWG